MECLLFCLARPLLYVALAVQMDLAFSSGALMECLMSCLASSLFYVALNFFCFFHFEPSSYAENWLTYCCLKSHKIIYVTK